MTTSLPTMRLGWTDMLLTRVGFGAWAIGGGGWGYARDDQDDSESIAAIRRAVESGGQPDRHRDPTSPSRRCRAISPWPRACARSPNGTA